MSWCFENFAVEAARSRKDTKGIAPDYVCHLVEEGGMNDKRGLDEADG